jgi:chaperone required for assembly of F1-ATPase
LITDLVTGDTDVVFNVEVLRFSDTDYLLA